jgi:hypothetical protein
MVCIFTTQKHYQSYFIELFVASGIETFVTYLLHMYKPYEETVNENFVDQIPLAGH